MPPQASSAVTSSAAMSSLFDTRALAAARGCRRCCTRPSMGLAEACALVTDGRFSGGSSGLSIGHVSPEAAEGGVIALVRDGDRITIDIPRRSITLEVDERELATRRRDELARGDRAFTPRHRDRRVSVALRTYGALVTSAAFGAVRSLDRLSVGTRH